MPWKKKVRDRTKRRHKDKHRTILLVVKGLGTELEINSETQTGKELKADC